MAATITVQNKEYKNGVETGQLKIAIPTADVLTLNTTAITVVAAPGSGKIVTVVGTPIYALTYASAAFATNVSLNLIHDTATLGTNALYTVGINQGASTIVDFTKVAVTTGPQYIANKALTLQVAAGDPTGGGTSTIAVYLTYRIITV